MLGLGFPHLSIKARSSAIMQSVQQHFFTAMHDIESELNLRSVHAGDSEQVGDGAWMTMEFLRYDFFFFFRGHSSDMGFHALELGYWQDWSGVRMTWSTNRDHQPLGEDKNY